MGRGASRGTVLTIRTSAKSETANQASETREAATPSPSSSSQQQQQPLGDLRHFVIFADVAVDAVARSPCRAVAVADAKPTLD